MEHVNRMICLNSRGILLRQQNRAFEGKPLIIREYNGLLTTPKPQRCCIAKQRAELRPPTSSFSTINILSLPIFLRPSRKHPLSLSLSSCYSATTALICSFNNSLPQHFSTIPGGRACAGWLTNPAASVLAGPQIHTNHCSLSD